MRRRVKITGVGPVTPAGIGKDAFWKGIVESGSRVRPFDGLGHDYGPIVAAFIDDFDFRGYLGNLSLPKGSSRQTQFAAVGAVLALQDAGLPVSDFAHSNAAIFSGSSLMDLGDSLVSIEAVLKKGVRGAKPRTVYTTNTAISACAINDMLGANARTMTLQSLCCSGLDAVGHAAAMIARGEADIAICGGTDAPLYRNPLLELRGAGLTPETHDMADKVVRPFDLWRTTGVISEGACMMVLEAESSPRFGYAYVSGYGFGNDPKDYLCGGMIRAIGIALSEARIRPGQVDSINAWGPGHRLIDAAESSALMEIFTSHISQVATYSIKSTVGCALGAAPAMQVAASAIGLARGIVPPTVNWQRPDPACPLNLSSSPRAIDQKIELVNAHGVAGVNSAMILEKC